MQYHGLLCLHLIPHLHTQRKKTGGKPSIENSFCSSGRKYFCNCSPEAPINIARGFAFLSILKNLREPFFYDRAKRKRLLCWVLTYNTKYRHETSFFSRYEQTAVIFAYAVGFRGKVGRQRVYLAEARLQGITETSPLGDVAEK